MEKIQTGKIIQLKKRLEACNDLKITENADMSQHTSFKAGGHAALLVDVHSTEGLKEALAAVYESDVPGMILGNGTNTLFKDSGYAGAVIRLLPEQFSHVAIEDKNDSFVYVTAGAGILLSALARILRDESLTGFEFASGIPGSLGGAIFMNAGAYDGEMRQLIRSVRAISADGRTEATFYPDDMNFGYRYSAFQENGYIVTEATLKLMKGEKEKISKLMKELADKRNSKQPVQYPSAGSTFKRPKGYFAGKLIEDAGLKGVTIGGAQVSSLHSGFIINKGGATAEDILQLITLVQNRVYDMFGVMLEPEVRIIG